MALTPEDIDKLATLARLGIDDGIKADVTAKLSDILAMIDRMQAVDTSDVEPMADPHDASQRLRKDEVTEEDRRDELLALAPATEDGLFLVPRVIE